MQAGILGYRVVALNCNLLSVTPTLMFALVSQRCLWQRMVRIDSFIPLLSLSFGPKPILSRWGGLKFDLGTLATVARL